MKSYLEGGVTFAQLYYMFEDADREEYDSRKFFAAIQGIDIENPDTTSADPTKPVHPSSNKANTGPEAQFLFKDPSEYDLMSEEERHVANDKMVKFWKPFADSNKLNASPRVVEHPS